MYKEQKLRHIRKSKIFTVSTSWVYRRGQRLAKSNFFLNNCTPVCKILTFPVKSGRYRPLVNMCSNQIHQTDITQKRVIVMQNLSLEHKCLFRDTCTNFYKQFIVSVAQLSFRFIVCIVFLLFVSPIFFPLSFGIRMLHFQTS